MMTASCISEEIGFLDREDRLRIEALLKSVNLPVRIPAESENIYDALFKDKKRDGGYIDFILLYRLGNALIKKFTRQDLMLKYASSLMNDSDGEAIGKPGIRSLYIDPKEPGSSWL